MTTNLSGAVAASPPFMPHPVWPYVVGLAAAAAFGLLGARSGHHRLPWAIGGGVLALIIATLASGLANAVALPYTESVIRAGQVIALVIAVAIITLLGLLLAFTSGVLGRRRVGGGRQP